MPVCLKCGKEIEPGEEYCEECGAAGGERVDRLLALAELNSYRPHRNRRQRWLTFSMLGLAAILVATALGLLISIPTGPEFRRKAQASICRSNMRLVQKAVDRFYEADGKYPAAGRVDSGHPLITDQYLDSPLRCPTTGRYYLLENESPVPSVRCDSNLFGHVI